MALLLGCSGAPLNPAAPPALDAPREKALSAEQLTGIFAAGFKTVDLFCAAADNCLPLAQKRALFQLHFRGSFAQVAGEDDVDVAYARQAVAYFMQSDYACRRPLTARVLETLWQLSPRAACAEGVPFLVDLEDGSRAIRRLDPARIAAVHLLFAGPSGKSFSRFGHAGLRLVACAPRREAVDASCDTDLQEHLSLSFRAAIDELDLSMWKGIVGGYPVRLYAAPFMSAYREYTIDEFRPLSSLPLRLSSAARELLVRALAEVHWSYQNDYRFLSRNCASELSWLLRVVSAVAGAELAWLDGANVRPDHLYARAAQSAAFDGAVFADAQQAERDGYWFPSSRAYYEMALDTLAQRLHAAGVDDPARGWDDFRQFDADARRRRLYEPALAASLPDAATLPTLERATQSALVLEAWVERRERRELLMALARYYVDMTKTLLARTAYFSDAERAELARCVEGFRNSDGLGRAERGVPATPVVGESGCALRSETFEAALEKLFRIAPLAAPQERQLAELRRTVENMNWLVSQIGPASGPSAAGAPTTSFPADQSPG